MTRLLVSVRSLEEAVLAAEAGVGLIDLKEPRRGSLGRVELDVARRVSDHLADSCPLSMAMGELADWSDADWTLCGQTPPGIVFVKIGLAGCLQESHWRDQWRRALRLLPGHCQAVAVIYADWRLAAAPPPEAILDEALDNGSRALLIDTWSKNQGDVFTCLAGPRLGELLSRARTSGLLTVLAGSLRRENLDNAMALAPEYVAVRGAVCGGSREAELCLAKTRQWVELVRERAIGQNDLADGDILFFRAPLADSPKARNNGPAR